MECEKLTRVGIFVRLLKRKSAWKVRHTSCTRVATIVHNLRWELTVYLHHMLWIASAPTSSRGGPEWSCGFRRRLAIPWCQKMNYCHSHIVNNTYVQVLKCTKHKHEETLHINLTLNALESIFKVGLPGILNLQAKSIDKWATTLIDCLNQSVKPAKFYARRNLLLWGMLWILDQLDSNSWIIIKVMWPR